ncbi:MAG: hypothetical protein J5548_04685 [Prevotella sp.]|nr:hypothetical protein [Prevotella sp.]
MKKAKYMALVLCTMVAGTVAAQDLRTGYFSDNFLYRHDINPALDNEENYYSIPLVGNFNVNMMGNFGLEELVHKNPLYPDRSDKKMTSFMNPYLSNPLSGFASGDNKVNGTLKETIFSMGFKKWGGYNTVELNVRAQADISAPYKLFEFAAYAENTHYEIGDIDLSAQAFTELSFGHSRKVSDKMKVGAKAKLLLGMGDASVKIDGAVADLSDANQWVMKAKAQSDVSMNGFKYISKTKEYSSKPGTCEHVNDVDLDAGGPSGFGLAVDAGLVYKLNDDVTLSASLLDLGAIVWTKDFRAENDEQTFVFDGFHDVTIGGDSPNVLDKQADSYTDQLLDFANLRDKGDKGARVTGIGTTINVGAEYVLPTFQMLKIGLLGSTRINGPHSWSEARLSGNISPNDWFDGTLALAVNSYQANLGFLANFHAKKFNFFVGMDCLLGKMSKELIPLNSNGGLSFGFNVKM